MRRRILELIWQGVVRPLNVTEAAMLQPMLSALLPMPIVSLKAGSGADRIAILPDELEVMPALPLGDVIVEELSVDVPYGALVLICDAATVGAATGPDRLSRDLGAVVGQTLLTVLRRGAFPLEHENEALYTMACAYDRMARTIAMQSLGLVPWEFSRGLAETLGGYWSGSHPADTAHGGLFMGANCLANPELRHYLSLLDAGFAAPQYGRIPSDLLLFRDPCGSFADWLDLVRDAVTGVLLPRRMRLIQS